MNGSVINTGYAVQLKRGFYILLEFVVNAEIEIIDMLRRLDTVNRYYIVGQIAALIRDQEKEKIDQEAAKSSTSKVG